MDFEAKTLPSGRTVSLRGRTYTEWEACENDRIAQLDEIGTLIADGKGVVAEAAAQRNFVRLREKKLALCVENWSEVRGQLALRDIIAIEALCAKLEQAEVIEGN